MVLCGGNTRSYYLRLFFLGIFVFASANDVTFSSVADVFSTPDAADASRVMLTKLFGSVGGVLTGEDGLSALLFRIFNVAVLVFGSLFAGITVLQGVIQTAFQGVFLGKKGGQSAYFTMLRTFGGLALVFPRYNGYSTIQTLVMTLVIKSVALASNLSYMILQQSMTFSQELLFDMPEKGSLLEQSLEASLLRNTDVQDFYKATVKGAICAVEHNRKKETDAETFPSKLYKLNDDHIQFVGCAKTIPLKFRSIEGYRPLLQNGLRLLIDPIMNRVFYGLPKSLPKDMKNRCDLERENNNMLPLFLSQIKRNIETNHDNFASSFVLMVTKGSASKRNAALEQDYLRNWIDFPIMYQSVMDLKARGKSIESLDLLVQTALEELVASWDGGSISSNEIGYTSLGNLLSNDLSGNETSYDQMIDDMKFISAINLGNKGFVSESDTLNFEKTVKQYLATLTYRDTFPTSDLDTLEHIWDNVSWKDFDDGAATFHKEQQRLKGKEDTERALKAPVNSFVYYSGKKWVDTYVTDMSSIVLSPARKLGEVASYLGGQSTLFMFVTLRNVMAEQITRSWNLFWTFLWTKLSLKVAAATTGLIQEQMWDRVHCLQNVPQPVAPSANPRAVACNPFMFGIFPNPGWWGELAVTYTFTIVATAVNVVTNVTESIVSGLFTYLHMLSSQYEYAYYGYLVMAVTPVMVISNLLSIWIPMMPSLIYFIAVIGWIFAVIEAMIAAPLVVMGITFPQGHDFLGSSQQALSLLMSLFVRAPLIVISFFISMLLLSIGMLALSYGLVPIGLDMFVSQSPDLSDGFLLYAFMVITLYVTSILLLQSMSIIYKLPNKIILWMGGQPSEGTEESAVQDVKRWVDGQMGSIHSATGQAATGAKSGSEGVAAQSAGGFRSTKSW